jgi:cysteinyl-tRNA synthetase
MKIYNSITQKKEEFKPLVEGKVSMYVCGPTVYNFIHIGNARPMITFDLLRRLFEFKGYEVTHISNFTDVDDKIINKAEDEGVSENEISERFIKAYLDDSSKMNIVEPTHRPKVTDKMDEIIEFISDLVNKEYAYEVNGNVYFRVNKIKDYGRISNRKIDDLISGARIEVNGEKEDALDFTL